MADYHGFSGVMFYLPKYHYSTHARFFNKSRKLKSLGAWN